MKIQLPEEEVTLCFPTETEKDAWTAKLVEAISRVTLGPEVSDDLINAPSERTGTYKFRQGRLKGCSYSGEWFNGMMQGNTFSTYSPYERYIYRQGRN